MNEHVRTHNDVLLAIREVITDIQSFINVDLALSSHSSSGIILDKLIQVCFKKKYSDQLKQAILEIILTHCMLAEKTCPGTFLETTNEVVRCWDQIDVTCHNSITEKQVRGVRATKNDILSLVCAELTEKDELMSGMFSEVLELCSITTKILVEKTTSQMASVELATGYTFETPPNIPVVLKLDKPKVLVIDGYIESVSEIHRLLEDASTTKTPVLLFVRGLSDDVLNTLSINYTRGSVIVIPFVVKFDLESANVLNDIAIVSGCDVVSSNKGQLISAIAFETLSTVTNAQVFVNKLTINNVNSRYNVKNHLQLLKKKKFELNNDDVGRIYDKRIASLTSNKLVIRLPDDTSYVKRAQLLDVAIRKMRSIIEYGVSSDRKQLALHDFAIQFYSDKCFKHLQSIGAAVYV